MAAEDHVGRQPAAGVRHGVQAVLLGALLVRLVHLQQPLVERFVWRSVDNASITRNFLQGGLELCWPRVDWAGPRGLVETEAPLQMWFTALCYRLVGAEAIWLGRLVTVSIGMMLLVLFYRLARRVLPAEGALAALVVLAFVPTSIFFSRNLQQEALMLAAQVGALLCAWRWLEGRLLRIDGHAVGVLACLSLGALIKPTALLVGVPLLALALQREGWRALLPWTSSGSRLWTVAVGALVLPVLWYGHARLTYLESGYTFGIFSGGHDKFQWGRFLTSSTWYVELASRYLTWHLTVPGLVLACLGGLRVLRWRGKARALLVSWSVVMLASVPLVAEGHYDMLYYQWVTVPPLAMLAGAGADWLLAQRRGGLLSGLAGLGLLGTALWTLLPAYESRVEPALALAGELRSHLPPGMLILDALAYDYHNPGGYNYEPMTFYYSGHKGWGLLEEELTLEHVESYRRRGAGALVTWRTEQVKGHEAFVREVEARYHVLVDTPGRWIVLLEPR